MITNEKLPLYEFFSILSYDEHIMWRLLKWFDKHLGVFGSYYSL